jgi:hypothetical protein
VHPIESPEPTPLPPTSARKKPDQARPVDIEQHNIFTFKTHSVAEKHDGYSQYEISAEYPEAISKRIAVKRFNRWIKRKVLGDVRRFRGLELRDEPRLRRLGKRSITEGLDLGFIMYYSDNRLISLRLTHGVMAAGQMHPINYYETINYDLGLGRPLRARDVFRRGYLKVFSGYSRKWLTETYEIANDNWFMEGTAPRAANFPNWNIVPGGVLISFEDYQVSSHSFGQPELMVPYSVLNRSVRKRDLSEHFAKRQVKTLVGQTGEVKNQEGEISIEPMIAGKFTYGRYLVRKHHRKIKIEDAVEEGRQSCFDDEYATLIHNRRTVFRFDAIFAPLGNSIQIGLLSLLGRGPKQLLVSQDTFRSGRQWVVSLARSPHIIYDGGMWATGREVDDLSIIDLDADGIYEIRVPTCIFYGFANLNPASTPLPTIIFKYSRKAGRYLPANPRYASYLLAKVEDRKRRVHPSGDQINNMDHLGDVLSIVLDYVFAGNQRAAWTFYDQTYKLPDKDKIKTEILTELSRSPVYRFLNRKQIRHRLS